MGMTIWIASEFLFESYPPLIGSEFLSESCTNSWHMASNNGLVVSFRLRVVSKLD